jgi:MoaA/NifB/PqqE/SkfB family radical SAM enzyme
MPSKSDILMRGAQAVMGLAKAKLLRRRTPVRVSLLVTKRCNLRCFYCYAKDILNARDVKEPTREQLIDILDQMDALGCRWVNVLGGEPLIRDDIDDIISHALAKKMYVTLTTNGYFVKRRLATLRKVHELCISLDGDKEANDRSRGEGSFEHIIEGIECAVASGLKVRVHATLCRRTMAKTSLDFLAGFCKRLGIIFNYSENGLPGIEKLDPDFLLSEEETQAFYQGYRALKKRGYPIVSSDVAVGYAARWPLPGRTTIYKSDLGRVPRRSYYPCQLGRNQCFISADGNVYACTKKWGYGKNLFDVGFKEAWDYLAELDCVACKELGTIEQSVITGLDPRAIINAAIKYAL